MRFITRPHRSLQDRRSVSNHLPVFLVRVNLVDDPLRFALCFVSKLESNQFLVELILLFVLPFLVQGTRRANEDGEDGLLVRYGHEVLLG